MTRSQQTFDDCVDASEERAQRLFSCIERSGEKRLEFFIRERNSKVVLDIYGREGAEPLAQLRPVRV